MKPYDVLVANKHYAVIGLNDDSDKFANKIYKLLKVKGKTPYGINPRVDIVDGDRVYHSISEVEHDIDVAVFVVNPKIGIGYLEDVKAKGIDRVWLQPGTHSDELEAKASELGLNVIQACVLAEYAHHESK